MIERPRHLPPCTYASCAACVDGYCIALTTANFPGRRICPFYKSRDQIKAEDVRTKERLRRLFGDCPPITFCRTDRRTTKHRGDESNG